MMIRKVFCGMSRDYEKFASEWESETRKIKEKCRKNGIDISKVKICAKRNS